MVHYQSFNCWKFVFELSSVCLLYSIEYVFYRGFQYLNCFDQLYFNCEDDIKIEEVSKKKG